MTCSCLAWKSIQRGRKGKKTVSLTEKIIYFCSVIELCVHKTSGGR